MMRTEKRQRVDPVEKAIEAALREGNLECLLSARRWTSAVRRSPSAMG